MWLNNLLKNYMTITSATIVILGCATGTLTYAGGHPDRRERERNRTVHQMHRTDDNNKYHYSYHNGHYYKNSSKGKVVVKAPLGKIVISIPGNHRRISHGLQSYYYCDGVFYNRHKDGYKIIRAPRLKRLPRHTRHIRVNGLLYYIYNDLYYCLHGGFYEVCEPPVVVERQVVHTTEKTTLMIENSNGSRTPVEIYNIGNNQWKGPKGEIYDGFPSNDQLQDAYGF